MHANMLKLPFHFRKKKIPFHFLPLIEILFNLLISSLWIMSWMDSLQMLLKSVVNIFMQDFDPIRHVLEHVPSEENELAYFEKQVLPLMFLSLAINGKYIYSYIWIWNVLCVLCWFILLLNEL